MFVFFKMFKVIIKEGYFSWDQFYSDIIDLNDLNNINLKYDKLKNEYNYLIYNKK